MLAKAVYVVLGATLERYKEILSVTAGANKANKF